MNVTIYVTPVPATESYRKISHLRHVFLRSTINLTPRKLHIPRKSIIIRILH
jgi:hypothetical protein